MRHLSSFQRPAADPVPAPVAALTVEQLHKRFGDRRALEAIDLEVRPGELVVLMGPNGAGKTTLLEIIAGLSAADTGRVRIAGRDLAADSSVLAGVGFVFQMPTVDLELSLLHNLVFHAGLHGYSTAMARARGRELLERFGLAERAAERAGALSGGNRRRLELARALMHRPALIVMDEPTVGLDPRSRAELAADIQELKGAGISILWTTHLIDEARGADRLIVMTAGHIRYDGAPADLPMEGETLADAYLRLTGSQARQ